MWASRHHPYCFLTLHVDRSQVISQERELAFDGQVLSLVLKLLQGPVLQAHEEQTAGSLISRQHWCTLGNAGGASGCPADLGYPSQGNCRRGPGWKTHKPMKAKGDQGRLRKRNMLLELFMLGRLCHLPLPGFQSWLNERRQHWFPARVLIFDQLCREISWGSHCNPPLSGSCFKSAKARRANLSEHQRRSCQRTPSVSPAASAPGDSPTAFQFVVM